MTDREPSTRADDEAADEDDNEARDADWKMYTGEPVEEDGKTERPQQMNVGRDNMQGGGEWPDPDTPPTQHH